MRIGIDLGGTKIEAIALSPGGEEIARRTFVKALLARACLTRQMR